MPDKEAWNTWSTFKSFDAYFKQDSMQCLKHSMFKDQQKKDAAADAAAEKAKQAAKFREEHCVYLYEHPKFQGANFKYCLDPNEATNQFAAPSFLTNGFNDRMSSMKVGKYVIANIFENGYHNGNR